ncbi:unnamed protein product [Enterobius vermicularis]|uniref:NOP5NT domain-containing protein n=1 Tax=Enterobius vermicularis TaxID=51028 RepID=A0A0N4UXH6_ENTVE|nr:unnamed protein product [Enterobius vermicularis]
MKPGQLNTIDAFCSLKTWNIFPLDPTKRVRDTDTGYNKLIIQIMLVLFETSAGYAVFKLTFNTLTQLLDEKKLKDVDDIYTLFSSPEKAQET